VMTSAITQQPKLFCPSRKTAFSQVPRKTAP
jgi:hypothetical protein